MLLTQTNHTASSEQQFENDQFMSFMENNSGFPELRYFRFEDRDCWDPDARVFQYCCEKSPKLEEIHFVGSDQKIIENVSKSIERLGWFTAYFTEWLDSTTEDPIQPSKRWRKVKEVPFPHFGKSPIFFIQFFRVYG